MNELGAALKSIFDKISDFFDILDLSFFVSGTATVLMVYLWISNNTFHMKLNISGTLQTVALVLACYISGLICFAIGRWIRMGFWRWIKKMLIGKDRFVEYDKSIHTIIIDHGIEDIEPISSYLARSGENSKWRLYVRLWADIRHDDSLSKSLVLLKRYWVMAATYDGLSISVFISIILFLDSWIGVLGEKLVVNIWVGLIVLVIQSICFLACLREADRYTKYQLEELLATIASKYR